MKRSLLTLLLALVALSMWAQGFPPTDFAIEVQGANVVAQWGLPGEADALYWDNGVSGGAIGTGDAANFLTAARFEPSDLGDFANMELFKVKIHPSVATTACTYTLKVWQGGTHVGDAFTPGAVVHSQVLTTLISGEFNEIELSTPVAIDTAQELWIGYEVDTTTGYPAGTDDSDVVPDKGALMYFDDAWVNLASINATLDNNWNIRGYARDLTDGREMAIGHRTQPSVETPVITNNFDASDLAWTPATHASRDASRALTHFRLYRDGALVEQVPAVAFSVFEENIPAGDYSYYMTALDGGVESNPTAVIDVTIEPVEIIAPTDLQANVFNTNNVYCEWKTPTPPMGEEVLNLLDADERNGSIGDPVNQKTVVHRYLPAQLTAFNDQYLTQVSFYPVERSTYEVNVYTGGSYEFIPAPTPEDEDEHNFDPGTQVVQQWAFGVVPGEWNVINLDTPVLIDASQELWFGYTCHGTAWAANPSEAYPIGHDSADEAGTYDMQSNIMKGGTSWYTLPLNSDPPIWGNFLIHGFVSDMVAPAVALANGNDIPMKDLGAISLSRINHDTSAVYPRPVANRVLEGYKVYREDIEIGTVNDINRNFYVDEFVDEGTYTYTVKAQFTEGLSTATNGVSVDVGAIGILPPTGTDASVYDMNNIRVTWNAPSASNTEEVLVLDTGVFADGGLGTGNDTFNCAQRYLPGDLTAYDGELLSKVSFVLSAEVTEVYVKVWQGGSADIPNETATPGTLVSSQLVENYNVNAWTEVTLYRPVTIDASQEMWIGYFINGTEDPANTFPALMDNGPCVDWQGNLIGYGSNPGTFESVNLGTQPFDQNFLIRGWIDIDEQISRESRTLDAWKIYRNNEMIATVPISNDREYNDANLAQGEYEYYVVASYDTGDSVPGPTASAAISYPRPLNPSVIIPTGGARAIIRWQIPNPVLPSLVGYKVYKQIWTNGEPGTPEYLGGTATTNLQDTSFSDDLIWYWITAAYGDANIESYRSDVIVCENRAYVETGTDDNEATKYTTELVSNYPNPFNPSTTINFTMEEAGDATIEIYNLKGQKVFTHTDTYQTGARSINWDGKDSHGMNTASGVYFYRMKSGRYTSTKKMVLMK